MQTDVVIIGGGPSGATTAILLAKRGVRCVIVEREAFPRFHIGESMTGECGRIVRELGLEAQMAELGAPQKRGVTVVGPGARSSFHVPVAARTDDGRLTESVTWQVRRSDFDRVLLDEAEQRGAVVLRGDAVKVLAGEPMGVAVRTPDGEVCAVRGRVLVDASGARTFLAREGFTSPKERGGYDRQVAVFSHVAGAQREAGPHGDDTVIYYRKKHEWSWFIPVDSETVSIGFVVPASELAGSEKTTAELYSGWLSSFHEGLAERAEKSRPVEPVRTAPDYSYRIARFTGKHWLCVGDAHRFVDPIFSFGLHLALSEATKAADAIERALGGEAGGPEAPFADYERACDEGQDVVQDIVDAFWEQPLAFGLFVHQRYVDAFKDLFAGRIYGAGENPGLLAVRRLLAASR